MVKRPKLKKVTYYFTAKKIKGVDGKRLYHVTNKNDIKYLGSRNSKYTAFTKTEFKQFMKEFYNQDVKIINVSLEMLLKSKKSKK